MSSSLPYDAGDAGTITEGITVQFSLQEVKLLVTMLRKRRSGRGLGSLLAPASRLKAGFGLASKRGLLPTA